MKISLYFIFYVVMILELLIFIMERDEAADQHRDDVAQMLTLSDSLAREFSGGLNISVPETTAVTVYSSSLRTAMKSPSETARVVLVPLGLWSDAERHDISFAVYDSVGNLIAEDLPGKPSPRSGPDRPLQLTVNRETGYATVNVTFPKEGRHRFTARCSVPRSVPEYYPRLVKESVTAKLRALLGSDMKVGTRAGVPFMILAKSDGQRLPPCEYCGQGPYRK